MAVDKVIFYSTRKALLKRGYLIYKKRAAYKEKIDKIFNITKRQSCSEVKPDIDKYKKRWEVLYKRINPDWYKVYSNISGIDDINYVPEDLYYGIIEPILNDYSCSSAYSDKNFYNKFYPDLNIFPETLLRNINGIFYSSDYMPIENINTIERYFNYEPKIIIKPSMESGGGRRIQIFYKESNGFYYTRQGKKLTLDYLKANYYRDFLIQKYIKQADYFKELNPTSLNTVKITTYRSIKTNKILTNNCELRIGKVGAEIDNITAGGVLCFINEDGQLSKFALDKYGKKVYNLPSNPAIKFSDLGKVPGFDEMKAIAEEITRRNYYHRILGIDFCVDSDNNVKLIEINNCSNDINAFQMHGKPFFSEYTDEVLEYCSAKIQEGFKYVL